MIRINPAVAGRNVLTLLPELGPDQSRIVGNDPVTYLFSNRAKHI